MITTWPTLSTLSLHPEVHVTEQLITLPTIEPIDLDEVKKHLRFTPTTEDTLIDTYIAAARQYFEDITGLQLMEATWEQRHDVFPGGASTNTNVIELRHPPLMDVVSVAYDDGNGDEQTLVLDTDYFVETPSAPQCGYIRLGSSGTWPSSLATLGSVRVRYRAGYGSAPGDVPELIKTALLFLVGHFHQFRAEFHQPNPGSSTPIVLPIGADAIMRMFKSRPTRPPMRRG